MIARILAKGTRNIHSTTSVFCKVNVNSEITYSNEETEKILSVVNSSSFEDLTDR